VEWALRNLLDRRLSSPSSAAWSCQTYARLLAGESVSWGEILREHPLLGSITVPKLVEAGAVQVAFIDDPQTAMTDIRLTLLSCASDPYAGPGRGQDRRMAQAALGAAVQTWATDQTGHQID